MRGHGSKFGRKKEAAIVGLLTQRNVEEAPRAAAIGIQTLLWWMKRPECKTAYGEARREAVTQASARLQQGSGVAALTMLKIMVGPGTSESTRVRAADRVLLHGRQGIEMEDIQIRIAALERAAEQKQ